jgi:hypothetical protein
MPETLSSSVIEFLERLNLRREDGAYLSFLGKAKALARASQLSREFYAALRSHYPELADKAVFLWFAKQPDDTWMVFDLGPNTFGIQVDPELEVIVLFDGESQQEFGGWHNDLIGAVVAAIGGRCLTTNECAEDKWRPSC